MGVSAPSRSSRRPTTGPSRRGDDTVAGTARWPASCPRPSPWGRPAGRRPGPRHDLTGRVRRGVGDRPRTRVGQGVRHPPVRHERQADAHPWHRRPARGLRRRDRHPRGQAAVDRRRRHRPLRPDGHGHRRHRPSASSSAVVPALVGTVAAIATLVLLLRGTLRPTPRARNEAPPAVGRRQFLLGAAAVGAMAATAGGVGRALARRFDVAAARSPSSSLPLRRPPRPCPPPPTSASRA